jgi:hypothetical protein
MRRVKSISSVGAFVALALACLFAALPVDGYSTSASARTNQKSQIALAQNELLPPSSYPNAFKPQGRNSRHPGQSFFFGASGSFLSLLTGCIGIPQKNVDASPTEAAGEEYDLAQSQQQLTVNDNVEVFPKAIDAVTDVEAAANPKTPRCVMQLAIPGVSRSVAQTYGRGNVGRISVVPGLVTRQGDRGADLITMIPITHQGHHYTLYYESVFVQEGRAESSLLFTSIDSPPSLPTVDAFDKAVAVWMSQAQ